MSLKKFLLKACQMPPFPHSVEGEPYDVNNSEAVRWLMEQPETKEYVMEKARGYKAVSFDPAIKRWAGTGKSNETAYSQEEVVSALAGNFMKSQDLLAKCAAVYERECGMWAWNTLIKSLVEKGVLVKDGALYAVAR